ncbi:Cytochrome b561 domain-containing protein [Mycena kentingensis (nom. inval.)]|nr:Cytochrome b561 domain-containing protein [Mycena kentingensis (nom. inval.)]
MSHNLKESIPTRDDDGGGSGNGGLDLDGIPLTTPEIQARNHAIIMTVGFLIMLPLGVLVARFTRTWFKHWFWTHATIQLLLSAPLIFYGASLGVSLATQLGIQDQRDTHQSIGIALLALYATQLLLGAFSSAHFSRLACPAGVQRVFWGGLLHRAPWNYAHVLLGLAILALAGYQVHYGLDEEWEVSLGGLHEVPQRAFSAWMALIIVFWVLYFVGFALLPKQFRAERTRKREQMARRGSVAKDGEVVPESA